MTIIHLGADRSYNGAIRSPYIRLGDGRLFPVFSNSSPHRRLDLDSLRRIMGLGEGTPLEVEDLPPQLFRLTLTEPSAGGEFTLSDASAGVRTHITLRPTDLPLVFRALMDGRLKATGDGIEGVFAVRKHGHLATLQPDVTPAEVTHGGGRPVAPSAGHRATETDLEARLVGLGYMARMGNGDAYSPDLMLGEGECGFFILCTHPDEVRGKAIVTTLREKLSDYTNVTVHPWAGAIRANGTHDGLSQKGDDTRLASLRGRLPSVTPGGPDDVVLLEDILERLRPGIWAHAKRGTRYQVQHVSRLQVDGAADMSVAVSYLDVESGYWWTRPLDDFLESGRFVRMAAAGPT